MTTTQIYTEQSWNPTIGLGHMMLLDMDRKQTFLTPESKELRLKVQGERWSWAQTSTLHIAGAFWKNQPQLIE